MDELEQLRNQFEDLQTANKAYQNAVKQYMVKAVQKPSEDTATPLTDRWKAQQETAALEGRIDRLEQQKQGVKATAQNPWGALVEDFKQWGVIGAEDSPVPEPERDRPLDGLNANHINGLLNTTRGIY